MTSRDGALRRPERSRLAAPPGAGRVLADSLPGDRSRDYALAAGYALLVGVVGQWSLTVPATPLPVTAQTATVLVGAAVLGWRRALAGMVGYAVLGLLGMPWFAEDGAEGLLGAMRSQGFGYVLGFVVASMIVGGLAPRGFDRLPQRAVGMFGIGALIVYGFGVPWLMASQGFAGLRPALAAGVVPFLPLDIGGIALGSVLLPVVWLVLRRRGG